jgi:hypothetical protein
MKQESLVFQGGENVNISTPVLKKPKRNGTGFPLIKHYNNMRPFIFRIKGLFFMMVHGKLIL